MRCNPIIFVTFTTDVIVLINVLYFYIFTSYVGKGGKVICVYLLTVMYSNCVDPEERLEKPQKLIGINIAFVISKQS